MIFLDAFSRWRWSLLVVALVMLVICLGINYSFIWEIMGVTPMLHFEAFADMEAVLAAGEAWVNGHDPYLIPNLFDSYGRPHVYGPGWLISGWAGFTVAHVAELSFIAILGFLASLFYWYQPPNGRMATWTLAALLSPPILLGLERANNDLIMIILISMAAALSPRKGALFTFCVMLLLSTAAWLKIYPLVGGIGLFTLPGDFRYTLKVSVLWLCLTCIGFGLYADDYLRILPNIPHPDSIFAYDLRYSLTACLGGLPGFRIWTLGGTLFAGGLALKILWRLRSDYWQALPLTGAWAFFTVSAAAIWVGCLLAGSSHPYRAVWLLPLLAWSASAGAGSAVASRSLGQLILLSLGLYWLQWQCFFQLLEKRGVAYKPIMAVSLGLTNAVVVLLTTLVAWMLVGWGVRRMRSLIEPGSCSLRLIESIEARCTPSSVDQ